MKRISAAVVSASLLAALGVGPALAALSPYYQSAREIGTIVDDERVHDALKYEEPILSITTGGDDVYLLKTERCKLTVTVVDKPDAEPMMGPRQFDLDIGEAECE